MEPTVDNAPATSASQKLARLFGVALSNPAARQELREAFDASNVKEGKLHLRSFLTSSGNDFMSHLSSGSEVQPVDVHRLLDQLPQLEVYLPVVSHRDSWTGYTAPLVAVHIDESENIHAASSSGEPVILSRSVEPSEPTISIVPAESFGPDGVPLSSSVEGVQPRFSDDCDPQAIQECGGSGGGGIDWDNLAPGLYVTDTYIDDFHEPWTRGEPEIEIFTFINDTTVDLGEVAHCAAESGGDSQFVQNDHSWDGAALIATPSQLQDARQLASAPDAEGLAIWMFEDDQDTCALFFENTQQDIGEIIAFVDAASSGFDGLNEDGGVLEPFKSLIDGLKGVFGADDDAVGMIAEQSCSDPSGTESFDATVFLDGSENGCASFHLNG